MRFSRDGLAVIAIGNDFIPMQHAITMYLITMYLVADVQCDAKTRMSAVEVKHLTPQNNAG